MIPSTDDKQTFEQNCKKYITSLQAMKIGDEKTYDIHQIKRMDKHTWEYTCPCCQNKRISIGGKQA